MKTARQTKIAKANKIAKLIATPDIYKDLTLPTKTIATERSVAIHTEGSITVMPKGYRPLDLEQIPVDKFFTDLEDFAKQNANTIKAYHEEFIGPVPKKQNIEETGMWVWAYFTKNGKPAIPAPVIEPKPGTEDKPRARSILARTYTLLMTHEQVVKAHAEENTKMQRATQSAGLPRQALEVIAILSEVAKPTIGEEQLRTVFSQSAERLKTKQDPWRIFQYYRAQLITNKILKHD